MIRLLKCVTFKNIAVTYGAAIANISNGGITLLNCKFEEISSNSFPGSFRVTDSYFTVNNCYFSDCSASGANECYGRIAYVTNSNVSVEHFSAIRCSTRAYSAGDSVNAFHSSDISISDYNTSLCYGTDGSSTVSIYSPFKVFTIKNINSADCIDWNVYEYYFSAYESFIEYSNYINSTKNSNYFLQINCKTTFRSCSFFNTHSVFCIRKDVLTFINCYSDNTQSGCIITSCNPNFTVLIKLPISCSVLRRNAKKALIKSTYVMILITCQ
jgi:hypothetical protein